MRNAIFNKYFTIIAVLLIFSGCAKKEETQKSSEPVEKITLGVYAGSDSTLVYIALDQGFFSDNALDIEIKEYLAGKLAGDAVISGEVDISTSADFVFVSNSLERPDLRIVGTVASSNTQELVARKDRGILHPKDLAGKRIGITRKSVAEYYLGVFLIFNDLKLTDVELVDLKPTEIVESLVKGDIDAGFTWNPNVYYIKQRLGENAVSWPGQNNQDYYFILMTTSEWIEASPSALKRFLQSLVQAENYVKKNKAKAKEFIFNRFSYDVSLGNSLWADHDFVVVLPQAILLLLENQAQWRIDNQLTDKTNIPNFLDFLHTETLDAINPKAVSIIR